MLKHAQDLSLALPAFLHDCASAIGDVLLLAICAPHMIDIALQASQISHSPAMVDVSLETPPFKMLTEAHQQTVPPAVEVEAGQGSAWTAPSGKPCKRRQHHNPQNPSGSTPHRAIKSLFVQKDQQLLQQSGQQRQMPESLIQRLGLHRSRKTDSLAESPLQSQDLALPSQGEGMIRQQDISLEKEKLLDLTTWESRLRN